MEMPILQPIPIRTKNHNILVRIYRWVTSIRQWEVVEDWRYELPDKVTVVIPKGFIFDGASIPRPLWFLLSPTGLLLIPGLIHDFAYRYDYLWVVDTDNIENNSVCSYKYKECSGQWCWDGLFREIGVNVNGMAIIDTLASVMLFLMGWISWRSNRKRNAPEILPDSFSVCDK